MNDRNKMQCPAQAGYMFPCRFCPRLKAGECDYGIPEALIDALNNFPHAVQPIHAAFSIFSDLPYVKDILKWDPMEG